MVHPQYRTVNRTVEQPGVIGAYERTALYAKVAGFVDKWNVDIGDRVKRGQTLVKLTAPEVVAQHQQMQAQVVLDRALVDQSHKFHLVAQRNAMAATEQLAQARSDVNRWVADVDRWESEVKRLTVLVAERVVNQQILDETTRQLRVGPGVPGGVAGRRSRCADTEPPGPRRPPRRGPRSISAGCRARG